MAFYALKSLQTATATAVAVATAVSVQQFRINIQILHMPHSCGHWFSLDSGIHTEHHNIN